MDENTILQKLEEIFRELFDEYEGPVTRELTAHDVEQWDSLGHIQLMVMIEKIMKMRFSAEEVRQLANLGELVDLIRTKKASPA
jgi:acyl carrier protein